MNDNIYVLYDEANDHVLQFEWSGKIVRYTDKQEVIDDCKGNESVVKYTDLPKFWQEQIDIEVQQELDFELNYTHNEFKCEMGYGDCEERGYCNGDC